MRLHLFGYVSFNEMFNDGLNLKICIKYNTELCTREYTQQTWVDVQIGCLI